VNGRDDSSWRHASGPDGPRNRQVQAKHSPLAVDPEARDAVGPRALPPPRTSRPGTGPATNWPSCSASRRATCSPSSAHGAGSGSSPAPAPAPTGSTRRQPRHPRHRRPTLNFAALGARQPCGLPWTPETSAAPGVRKSGQAQGLPRPGARRAGLVVAAVCGNLERQANMMNWRSIVRRRGEITNPGRGSRPGNLFTAEPPGEAASHRTRCA